MGARAIISLLDGDADSEMWLMAAHEEVKSSDEPRLCGECPLIAGGDWEHGAILALGQMSERQREEMRSWNCHESHHPCAGMRRLLKNVTNAEKNTMSDSWAKVVDAFGEPDVRDTPSCVTWRWDGIAMAHVHKWGDECWSASATLGGGHIRADSASILRHVESRELAISTAAQLLLLAKDAAEKAAAVQSAVTGGNEP